MSCETSVASTQSSQFDDGKPASLAVVQSVAALADKPVTALEPLYTAIDPDALNDLFAHDTEARVTFQYEGLSVSVDSEGVLVESKERVRRKN